MASSKDRERKLARAKIDRQMARRAEKVRVQRQRQSQIGIGLAILLVVAGIGWLTNWYGLANKSTKPTIISAVCTWTPADTTTNADLKADSGTPPTAGMPTTGTETMQIATSQGNLTAQLDATNAPCTTASFSYLASTKFFDGSTCPGLSTAGPYALECGDPNGKGDGGPAYTFADEHLPVDFAPAPSASPSSGASPSPSASAAPADVIYPAGTIAIAPSIDSSGAVQPNTGGSRFLIFYKDSTLPPQYSVFGKITAGMDVLAKIAKAGVAPVDGKAATSGAPKTTVTFNTVTVTPDANNSAAPSTAPSPSASSKS